MDNLPVGIKRLPTAKDDVPDFDDFVVRESADSMAERMQADTFVLGRLAIMGQSTVFYGGPNVGKTLIILKLLTEALHRED